MWHLFSETELNNDYQLASNQLLKKTNVCKRL